LDFLNNIAHFFITKEFSFRSKIFGLIMAVLGLMFLDNLFGFSFYYTTSKKINHLKELENLEESSKDVELIAFLNELEREVIQRKNVVKKFFNLFSSEPFDVSKNELPQKTDTVFLIKYDTIYLTGTYNIIWQRNSIDSFLINNKLIYDSLPISNEINKTGKVDTIFQFAENENTKVKAKPKTRSKLWHTISSTCALIFLIIVFAIFPFTEKKFSWNTFFGVILLILVLVGFIWLFQFLFGLIPVIWNRPWLNYILNIIIQTVFWVTIGFVVNNNEKKSKIKKQKIERDNF